MQFKPVITKIRAPRPPQALLRRRNISNPLGLDRLPKLVWVGAPAGYGKTSLVLDWLGSQFAEKNKQFKVAWYSLEPEDNDLNRLTSHLIAAIQEVDSSFGSDLQLIASSVLPVDYDSVFTSLINELATIELRVAIVLDDFHSIDSEEIHSRVEWFVRHLPDNVCVIATSRTEPPFEVSRLRINGDYEEVKAASLSLSDAETNEYFEAVRPGGDPQIAQDVNRSTQGWFAAVSLAAVAETDTRDEHSEPPVLSSPVFEQIFDYYAEEVVSTLENQARGVLTSCSILESFNADLAEHVSGQSGCRALLESAARANILSIQIDGPDPLYRFHPLMKEFLIRNAPNSPDSQETLELHLRAASWFRANGRLHAAFDHALLAENQKLAAETLSDHSLELFFNGAGSTLIRMTNQLDHETTVSHPQICVGRAYAHVMRFEFDEAKRFLSYASSAVDAGPRIGKEGRAHDPIYDRRVAGQIAVAEASIATFERDLPTCISRALEAIDLLGDDDPPVLEIAHVSLGTAYWGRGELAKALDAFLLVDRQAGDTDISLIRYMAVSNAGHVLVELGKLNEAEAMLLSTLDRWPAPSGQDYPFAAMAYTGLAEIALLRGDSKSAITHSARAFELAKSWGSAEVMLSAVFQKARSAHSDSSGTLIAEARDLAISRSNDWWLNRIESQQARFMARRDEPDQFVDHDNIPKVSYENLFDCLTTAEVLIAQRNFLPAGELIDRIEEFSALGGNRVVEASSQALRFLLAIRTGTPYESQLLQTIVAAASNRSWRLLLKHGPDLSTVLTANRDLLVANGASELLELIEGGSVTGQLTDRYQLSDRELEVLGLICDGMSNEEIGDRLFIAQSTIKTHINRLYRKIDVSTRAQAVSWAAQHGLFAG